MGRIILKWYAFLLAVISSFDSDGLSLTISESGAGCVGGKAG